MFLISLLTFCLSAGAATPPLEIIAQALGRDPRQREHAGREVPRLPNLSIPQIAEALELIAAAPNRPSPNFDYRNSILRVLRRSLYTVRAELSDSDWRPMIANRLTALTYRFALRNDNMREVVSLKHSAQLWTGIDVSFALRYVRLVGSANFGLNLYRLWLQMDDPERDELREILRQRLTTKFSTVDLPTLYLMGDASADQILQLVQQYGNAYAQFHRPIERRQFPAIASISTSFAHIPESEVADYVDHHRDWAGIREAIELDEFVLEQLRQQYLSGNALVKRAIITARVLGPRGDGDASPEFLEYTRKLMTGGFRPVLSDRHGNVTAVDFIHGRRCEDKFR